MPFVKANLYWHTLRYLKPVQFYGRLWFHFYKPKPDLSPAPALRAIFGSWQVPAAREPSIVAAEQFMFLNEQGDLSKIGWDGEERSKLWRYNQHYFDDLNARGSAARVAWHRALLQRWLEENPPGQGVGWDPYPTSLRIVNWVKWALAGNALPEACVQSLAVQARWLARRLEIHLLGNHLFANAKALVFAGTFFRGAEAERWLKIGMGILHKEVSEQILPDGGHFERSTMYHALALEDMADLVNALACLAGACGGLNSGLHQQSREFLQTWREIIQKMTEWLTTMCHPDGEFSFFNDAAFGVAPSCEQLLAYVERIGVNGVAEHVGSAHLANSGHMRLANTKACVLFDAAPVGPNYLPGHAHADTLSFELSIFAKRFIVNSGTSVYEVGPERLRQRGTEAHNTVVVDGENSSEVWGGFRVARRARPFGLAIDENSQTIQCAHDGYVRLSGKPVHTRKLVLSDSSLIVRDAVHGKFSTAEARFHFHPEWTCSLEASRLTCTLSERTVVVNVKEGLCRLEPSTYHPEFGLSIPNSVLVVQILQNTPVSEIYINW